MSNEELAAALGLLRGGRLADALGKLQELTAGARPNAEAWHLRSVAEQQLGLGSEARTSAARAVGIQPDRAAFQLHAGHLAEDAGHREDAIAHYRRATELEPGWAIAWSSLGVVLYDAERVPEAVRALEQATNLDPRLVRAWNNLGLALASLDRAADARHAFETALALDPRHALARYNLARLANNAGDIEIALAQALEAVRIEPRLVDAHLLAGDLYRKKQDLPRALASYRDAVSAAPGAAKARNALGHLLWEAGDTEGARREFETTLERHPASLRAALGARLLLPQVYRSIDHLEASRDGYREGLERLHEELPRFAAGRPADILSESRWTNFYLAYQGRDDRALQARYGDFLHGVLAAAAPDLVAPPARRALGTRRLRVGFLSHFFFDCTAGRYFSSWVCGLDGARFERFVYYTNAQVTDDTRKIAAAAEHFRHVPGRTIAALARLVRADELDVLVFPELGMHEDTFALAALRLAPVQCAGWGHPTTTGLPTIDWFLTCDAMEPPDASGHYRERLARLPGLGTRYDKPAGAEAASRGDFGLPEDRHLYLVPQSVFKIHPDNDALLADVLARDPSGLAVLFAAGPSALIDALVRRLKPVFASRGLATDRHLAFLPPLTHAAYLGVNRVCDVMLDTLHWSGGNTSLDAIAMGLPVVTRPGSLMRGRQSFGMLRLMGLEELVAHSDEDYVRIAVEIATDRGRREATSRALEERCGLIFGDESPVMALGEFLQRAATADR